MIETAVDAPGKALDKAAILPSFALLQSIPYRCQAVVYFPYNK